MDWIYRILNKNKSKENIEVRLLTPDLDIFSNVIMELSLDGNTYNFCESENKFLGAFPRHEIYNVSASKILPLLDKYNGDYELYSDRGIFIKGRLAEIIFLVE